MEQYSVHTPHYLNITFRKYILKIYEYPHLFIQQYSHILNFWYMSYILNRVYHTTQDIIILTLPLTTRTTMVEGGPIASPTSRLCQPERKRQDTSRDLTTITFRGDS